MGGQHRLEWVVKMARNTHSRGGTARDQVAGRFDRPAIWGKEFLANSRLTARVPHEASDGLYRIAAGFAIWYFTILRYKVMRDQ